MADPDVPLPIVNPPFSTPIGRVSMTGAGTLIINVITAQRHRGYSTKTYETGPGQAARVSPLGTNVVASMAVLGIQDPSRPNIDLKRK